MEEDRGTYMVGLLMFCGISFAWGFGLGWLFGAW